MTPFSAIITPQSVSFTTLAGKVENLTKTHKKWDEILELVKEIQKAIISEAKYLPGVPPVIGGSVETSHSLRTKLEELLQEEVKLINSAGVGRVRVDNGVVLYEDEPVHSAITERILWGLSEGFDMSPYMAFLDNAMENPSARAVDEMYGFMEKHSMGITADGFILGYKRVRENFKDIYTGTMDNSPGQVVKMKRNRVNDNPNETCSKGLHFCSMSYLPHYGAGPGNTIIIVKVNPRDIVSVPIDYNHAKVRCCEYLVLSEYTGDDKDDLLGTKAVWSDEDWNDEWDDEDEDNWDEDDIIRGEDPDDVISEVEDLLEEACPPVYDYSTLPTENQADAALEAARERATYSEVHLPFEDRPPVPLSEEGEDMRQIMDTVDAPHTEEGEAMRALIDVVEGNLNEEPPKAPALISETTEAKVLEAVGQLLAALQEKNKE